MKDNKKRCNAAEKIGSILHRRLTLLMLISFALAAVAGVAIQNYVQQRQSFTLINEYLADFFREWDMDAVTQWEEEHWMRDNVEAAGRETYSDNGVLTRFIKANTDRVSELDLVDENGIVAYSSNPDMIGFDLHDSEEMTPYLSLLDGEDYYAPPLYPNPFTSDPSLNMVYIGCAFSDNKGLFLIGIDEEAMHNRLVTNVRSIILDARIGVSGYLIACDADQKVIASTYTTNLEPGEAFERPDLLPQGDDINETITDLYGKKSYVAAVKKPDLYVIGVYPTKEADALRKQENLLFVLLFFLTYTTLAITLTMLLKSRVIKQVEDIHDSLNRITEGDLNEKVDVGGSLEFVELSTGINDTVDHLKDRLEQEKEALAAKMENARRIQESGMPAAFPQHESFALFAMLRMAEAVGGDFYDFYLLGRDTLVVVMADVSGNGMPAALYMMRAKTLIKTYAEQGLPVEQVAKKTNQTLCEDGAIDMFVSAWIAFLDLKSGVMSYVDAGHTHPVLVSDDVSFVKGKINLVLGAISTADYVKQEVTLRAGDRIFLYTYGVIEAEDHASQRYGEERLFALIREKIKDMDASDDSAFCETACQVVLEDVQQFSSGAEQVDDITMMWIKYKKPVSKDVV